MSGNVGQMDAAAQRQAHHEAFAVARVWMGQTAQTYSSCSHKYRRSKGQQQLLNDECNFKDTTAP